MKPVTRTPGARLLYVGYAGILRTVVDGGATWQEVSEAHNLSRLSSQRTLRHLADAGVIHEAAWEQFATERRTTWTLRYRIGKGPELPWPGEGNRPARRPQKAPVELLTFVHAVRALQDDSYYGLSLAEAVGIWPWTANQLLRRMHELRLVHIDDYLLRANRGLGPPTYTWGVDQKDKPKPRPRTAKENWDHWNKARSARSRTARLLGVSNDTSRPYLLHQALSIDMAPSH